MEAVTKRRSAQEFYEDSKVNVENWLASNSQISMPALLREVMDMVPTPGINIEEKRIKRGSADLTEYISQVALLSGHTYLISPRSQEDILMKERLAKEVSTVIGCMLEPGCIYELKFCLMVCVLEACCSRETIELLKTYTGYAVYSKDEELRRYYDSAFRDMIEWINETAKSFVSKPTLSY